MSQPFFDPSNEKQIRIMRHCNDVIQKLVPDNEFVYIIIHDKSDPTKFKIVSDPYFDDLDENNKYVPGKMVGTELTFADPTAFKRLFPEMAQLPPVHLPPNTIQNPDTGKPEGIPLDEVQYDDIKVYQVTEKQKNPVLRISVADPEHSEIGALWIAWKFSDITKKYGYNFTVAVSYDGKRFSPIEHLKNIPVFFDDSFDKNAGGMMEVYNLSPEHRQTIKTKYILIQINNNANPDFQIVNPLDAIATFRLTRSTAVS